MMTQARQSLPFVVLLLASVGCSNMNHAERGATLGALGGAGIGTAIGSASGNPKTGAVVGGLVGGVLGNIIGDDVDQAEARNVELRQAEFQQQYYQQQPQRIDEIVSLAQQGHSDQVILNHIRKNQMTFDLGVADLDYLKRNNVPDTVISEMQTSGQRVSRPVSVQPQRVIVEEQVIVPQPVFVQRPVYVRRPVYVAPCPPRSHFGIHVHQRW